MPKVMIRPNASRHWKFTQLANKLKIPPAHALGLMVSLWDAAALARLWDGILTGWPPARVAHECQWEGDPEDLIQAALSVGLLEESGTGALVIHDYLDEQGDVFSKNQRAKEARAKERDLLRRLAPDLDAGKAPPLSEQANPQDDIARQILQTMKVQKITGTLAQKREQVEAWRARGVKGSDILELVMNNPGTDIFDLKKKLSPAPASMVGGSQFMSSAQKLADEIEKRRRGESNG